MTNLTATDLAARNELTRARAALLQCGATFSADASGAISFAGDLTDEQWLLVDEAAEQDAAADRAAAKSARDAANALEAAARGNYRGYEDFR